MSNFYETGKNVENNNFSKGDIQMANVHMNIYMLITTREILITPQCNTSSHK